MERTNAERITHLKHQTRSFKVFFCFFLFCALTVILTGAQSRDSGEVRATRFLLVNPTGKVVGEFSAKTGVPHLTISDPSGNRRITLAHGYDIPTGLQISDGTNPRVDLSLRLDDSVALDLFDKAGKPRISISIRADGSTDLTFPKK
jgi:hypothetical protein